MFNFFIYFNCSLMFCFMYNIIISYKVAILRFFFTEFLCQLSFISPIFVLQFLRN